MKSQNTKLAKPLASQNTVGKKKREFSIFAMFFGNETFAVETGNLPVLLPSTHRTNPEIYLEMMDRFRKDFERSEFERSEILNRVV